MSHHPKKIADRANQQASRQPEVTVEHSTPGGFFSFTYSWHEMSLSDGKTHVRSRQTRFADGKLSSQEFEGTLDAEAYERMAIEAQRHVLGHATSLLERFWMLLPFLRR